jgi:hypothetical protein
MDDVKVSINDKIIRILESQKKMRTENLSLIRENEILQERCEEKEQELKKLSYNYNLLKLAKNFEASEQEKGDAEKQINNIVREINKCIALLNS